MTEEFILDIEGTGVVKHITFNMIVTWENDETEEKIDDEFIKAIEEKDVDIDKDEYKGPVVVLQEGIKEWCEATLEHNVYGRCKGLQTGDSTGGPELLFGSEGDRASFILKWL